MLLNLPQRGQLPRQKDRGLLIDCAFNEGTGDTIFDHSGNNLKPEADDAGSETWIDTPGGWGVDHATDQHWKWPSLNLSSYGLTTDALSIAIWCWFDTIANFDRIVDKTWNSEWSLMQLSTTSLGFYIAGTKKLEIGGVIFIDQWYHIALTVDINLPSNQIKLYLNGIEIQTGTQTAALSVGSNHLALFATGGGGNSTDGRSGPFRLWNRALSASEIQREYTDPWWRWRFPFAAIFAPTAAPAGDPRNLLLLGAGPGGA
jgi:hypothetical protein